MKYTQATKRGAADAHYDTAAMLRHEAVTPTSAAADGVPCTRGDVLMYGDQLSRSRTEPEWINGRFEPRLILPLSLSYDHRLIDGADAARFLRWVAEAFEQPFLLSVQG